MAERRPEDNAVPVEARLQVPSAEWLKVHGLSGQTLSLDQILPWLGFKRREGHVASLKTNVTSQYAAGLFTQQPNSTGDVYNLCGGSRNRLEEVERRLQEAVGLLKARHTWLNTGSRLNFGVVYGQRVVMVMDSCTTEHAQLEPFLDAACDVLRDQFSHVDIFTLIRCSAGVECWKGDLVKATDENITNAVDWVRQTPPQTPPIRTNIVEAIIKALSFSETDNIYLFTQGAASLRAFDLLLEKASPSLIPVHVVVFGCSELPALEKYRQLAQVSGATCHCYAPSKTPPLSHHSSLSSLSSAGSKSPPPSIKRPGSGRSSRNRPGSASSSVSSRPTSAKVSVSFLPPANFPLGNEDAELMWAELERARDTLADIQALCLEENVGGEGSEFSAVGDTLVSEDYMTSDRWLEVHGLRANKLMFQDLVGSLAFRHCEGRVQLPRPSRPTSSGTIEMIPHNEIVHAQYCKEFVHIRLEGERVVHVELTNHIHHIYQEKVERMLNDCRNRLCWLKQGSRELFGTLLEERMVIVIDTSSSMKDRLDLVKRKIQELIREQLKEKEKCTIFHFSSSVRAWRDRLVPASEQNLKAISQWVEGLVAEGSTNTKEALSQAMSVRGAQAVYLLTDGRPDQPESEVLAKVQQLPAIPVHTISFNCADSKANYFLSQLSSNTGGRYYYYSEDVSDPEGPKTYEGEDIRRLEQEIECGEEQLSLANQLLAECHTARKRGRNGKVGKAKKQGESKTNALSTPTGKKFRGFMSTKRWLNKNSLSTLKLTLTDALGPAAIPHTAKDVPILDKKVSSKVFDSLFPLAHVGGGGGSRVTLINPNGVDLLSYEERLRRQVDIYWERLTKLAWNAIPEEKRSSVVAECRGEEEEEAGSEVTDPLSLAYKDHRDVLRNALDELGWPRPQVNFDLLEAEIQRAENFIKYSESLRKEGGRRRNRRSSRGTRSLHSRSSSRTLDGDSSISIFSPTSSNSLIELLDQLELRSATPSPRPSKTTPTPTSKKTKPVRQNLRSQKVIARSCEDGFYYPGLVVDHSGRQVVVKLADGENMSVLRRFVIPIRGAAPCPVLSIGDHVLVQVRTRKGPHPSRGGSCDYYIPGTVQVLPEDNRRGHALHTVLVFNGRTVTCPRKGVVKITESLHNSICKFIKAKMSDSHSKEEQGSEYASYFSDEQSIQIDDSVSQRSRSVTQSPLATSPSHSSPERSKSRLSHEDPDGACDISGETAASVSTGQIHQQQAYEAEIKSLIENQQTQCELLEQYQRDLTELKLKQSEMELEMKRKEEEKSLEDASAVDAGNGHDSKLTLQSSIDEGRESSRGVEGEEVSVVEYREQAVNTGPWTEEKAIETDPMTESRGVGTEWSESSSDESESEVEEEEDEKEEVSEAGLLEGEGVTEDDQGRNDIKEEDLDTPVSPLHASTPLPSTPSHTTASPPHSHLSTPQHTSIPSPLHKTTPTPSHMTTPSPTHTTKTTPIHQPKDLSVLAEHFVKLGLDAFVGREVLARWPDDGWYYRAKVDRRVGQHLYQVIDACDDLETIHLSNIITDTEDAATLLQVGSTVVALHSDFAYSYAPGHVTAIHTTSDPELHYSVQLFDGSHSILPRHEIYNLNPDKYQDDVEYLCSREKVWIGQAVVARSDSDGLYYPATVEGLAGRTGRYVVRWSKGGTQELEAVHMFGPLTKRRCLRIGDYVIAQTKPGDQSVCMPAQIKSAGGALLQVEFCDSQVDQVDPTKDCFWVSEDYYQAAVEFIGSMVEPSSQSQLLSQTPSLASHSNTELLSEYSASYIQ